MVCPQRGDDPVCDLSDCPHSNFSEDMTFSLQTAKVSLFILNFKQVDVSLPTENRATPAVPMPACMPSRHGSHTKR